MDESAPPPILTIRNLSVSYHSSSGLVPAVRGVSFQICAGETLALVGESGCGKSSVALSIVGLLEGHEQSGRILYREREIQSLNASEWRKLRSTGIGIVFQDMRSALNPVLTILDHLVETIRAHQAISKKAARARSMELLAEVGVQENQAHLHCFELSGGTCQRVGIALAICNRPQLLIADEPTSSIDSALQSQVLTLLEEMQGRYGLSLLLISHDLPLVSQVSDRVCVMYDGRIVETGGKEEVLARPAHPYTRGLVQCQPSYRHHHERNPLASIPGSAPRPGEQFPGCSFASRCSRSEPRCEESVPAARAISETRSVACVHECTGDV